MNHNHSKHTVKLDIEQFHWDGYMTVLEKVSLGCWLDSSDHRVGHSSIQIQVTGSEKTSKEEVFNNI